MPGSRGRSARARKQMPETQRQQGQKPRGEQPSESPEKKFEETGKTPYTGWEYQHPDDHADEEDKAA